MYQYQIINLINSLKGEIEKPLPEKNLMFKCNIKNKENFEISLTPIEKSLLKNTVIVKYLIISIFIIN